MYSKSFRMSVCLLVLVGVAVMSRHDHAQAGSSCYGRPGTKIRGGTNNELVGTNGPDVLVAGAGDDVLIGLGGNDLLCGGPGDDLIFAGTGNDRVDGGPGYDFNSFNTPTARSGVKASLGRRRATGEGRDRWRGIEALTGSPGADLLTGSRRKDVILGVAGGDRIKGGPRDDLMLGLDGSDRLVGGGGIDLASFYFSKAGVRGDLSSRSVKGEGRDRLRGVEALEGSRSKRDVLTGNAEKNFFLGNGGDDLVKGGGGNDYLEGGQGVDRLVGETGGDRLFGQAGSDLLGAGGGMGLSEKGNDYLIGGTYAYTDGGDKLHGGEGKDLLLGGHESNLLDGGPGEDVVDYFGASRVRADLAEGATNGSFIDTYKSIEDFYGWRFPDEVTGDDQRNWIFGFGGADHIEGSDGNDVLKGVGGNDEIFGDFGNDTLNGGKGTDDLDGGIGIDRCRNGENTSMCELPLPGGVVPAHLPIPVSELLVSAPARPVGARLLNRFVLTKVRNER